MIYIYLCILKGNNNPIYCNSTVQLVRFTVTVSRCCVVWCSPRWSQDESHHCGRIYTEDATRLEPFVVAVTGKCLSVIVIIKIQSYISVGLFLDISSAELRDRETVSLVPVCDSNCLIWCQISSMRLLIIHVGRST